MSALKAFLSVRCSTQKTVALLLYCQQRFNSYVHM
jgi:hypothetical protein